ncbi:MAG TPA: phosphate ABC transporter permease subunit PstC [Pseudonocardiaceae bacterium]|nr:phosphate ABC transporter permease subunit PstC [Pseudonocardiaceae bacterium]
MKEPDIATTGRTPAPVVVPDGPGDAPPSSATSLQDAKHSTGGDTAFRWTAKGAGILVLILMAAVAAFLILKAIPAVSQDKGNFFGAFGWDPQETGIFGIAALAFGTMLSSAAALIIGVPVAVGVALFISQYAPRLVARPLAYVVDLLAAVPSVVFGLWGAIYLSPALVPLSKFLNKYFGWIPLFSSPNQTYGKSILVAAVVLAVMLLPIVAAISREVFVQTPKEHMEGALALGATKWEMIRVAVLPYGKSGVISAIVLGFGRAVGETIAVAMVLSSTYSINWSLIVPGGNTIAANIANRWGDANDSTSQGALIASGLVLFAITLVVNFGARAIIRRGKAKA